MRAESRPAIPEAGAELPTWIHTVAQDQALAWSEILDDPNAIHFDATVVSRLGLGDRPINQGPANLAYLYNMLADSFPTCVVTSLTARMVGSVFVGDTIIVSGRVRHVAHATSGCVVTCELALRTAPIADPVVVATAVVRFPSSRG